MTLSRRQFLVRTGWLAGGITVISSCSFVPLLPTFDEPTNEDALTWVQVTAGGNVTFYCPRAEMGQGIATGLAQVVAEELLVETEQIVCVYPDTGQIPPTQMTVGSQSIENFLVPTATAAATLREQLRALAASSEGLAVSEVEISAEGAVLPGGRVLTRQDLVDLAGGTVIDASRVDTAAELYSLRASTRVVGHPVPLKHGLRIVTGCEVYSQDLRLPDMAYGLVAHPPWLGAIASGADREAAMQVAGALTVVEGPDGEFGVVAETPMAARKMLGALKVVWPPLDNREKARIQAENDIDLVIGEDALTHEPIDTGDIAAGRQLSTRTLDVRYDTPMAAHAAMEPRSGAASWTGERCEAYTASQDPWYVQGAVARALGVSRDGVRVHNHRLGGGFGGRLACQATVEAAWLSRAANRPVKVAWTREDEFRYNYAGPQFSHRIQAGVDEDGDIAFWHHRMVSSPILTTSAFIPTHLHWAADLAPDPGTQRGTEPPYRTENCRVEFASIRRPMPTGAWRGLGAAPNTFAVECTMDELAELAGADPLAFRQRHALDARLAAVLEDVAALSNWQHGAGWGVAATAYKGVTFVAVVARVAREEGRPRVKGLWCSHDCGRVVNPDQVEAQIQGNLVWGISMALHERLVLESGIVGNDNFDSYAIARNSDTPAMHIRQLDSRLAPSGAGEAAFAPAAAAIVNAFASLDGTRTRQLPLNAG
jgi:CO/xanthine dehydrogenase Mo-binding subunit